MIRKKSLFYIFVVLISTIGPMCTGGKCVTAHAIKLFNKLPDTIKNLHNIDKFNYYKIIIILL